MNYHVFVDAFSIDELTHLENAIRERRIQWARNNATLPSGDEITMVKDGEYISAIKSYRLRTGNSLFVAKAVIDGIRK